MSVRRALARLMLAALIALGIGGVAAPAAAAPVAGVPGEVATYIATQLVDDLNEYYGPGTEGNGRLFTNTTTTGAGVRVFEFTPDFLAGIEADPPVRRVNDWLSVISIDKAPVGFAIVTIDPLTVKPQLGTYTESADFGTIVLALPESASLVRDIARSAWFALDGDELTPIVAGSSGVTTPTSVDAYRTIVATPRLDDAPAPDDNNGGLLIVGLILVLIVLLLALEAALPYWRRRAREKRELDAALAPDPAADAEPEPEVAVEAPAKPRAPRKKPPAST